MKTASSLIAVAIGLAACTLAPKSVSTAPEQPMTWTAVTALPQPPPLLKVLYGPDSLQFGELELPQGAGPFPVVVLVHGGCWQSEFDYQHVRPLAAAIAREGFAVWTIEYRRLGDAGGGWPNTFLDAGAALDHLRALVQDYPLDLRRIVVAGHSAGGQLALWLATRERLPASSDVQASYPLQVAGVIGLAPITNLVTYRIGAPDSCNAAVDPLLGGTPSEVGPRYLQTSPLQRLPLALPVWLIQGLDDRIVPPSATRAYAEAARAAGDTVSLSEIAGAGHFDSIVPGSAAWPAVVSALRDFKQRTQPR